MERVIRVLVCDDSAFMRSALKGMLHTDRSIQVVATARDGEEAIRKVKQFQPDIVTMDVEMPRVDGLTAIRTIMQENPLPILVVSSLTEEGAQVTMEAMEAGAVDFLTKNLGTHSLNIMNLQEDLINRIKSIVAHQHKFRPKSVDLTRIKSEKVIIKTSQMGGSVLAVTIGVSTGGPKALQEVIPVFPADFPVPVIVVQHMPVAFTKCFAERMDSVSQLHVKEAEAGEVVKAGTVYIAKGGIHTRLIRTRLEVAIEMGVEPQSSLYRPSVNEMMLSASRAYGGRLIGVIMTGMGNDGCIGMAAIKEANGKTIVQDEASCVVYGMPKAVVDAGLADKIAPLESLATEIVNMV